jgi:hypothetical protein
MDSGNVTKIDIAHADSQVRFSLRSCSTKKKHSTMSVDRSALAVLSKRLMHLEDKYTWRQLAAEKRNKGLTSETKGSKSYNEIHECRENCEGSFGLDEDYYFHFRVKDGSPEFGKFRIFGYQKDDMFCITHFDVKGLFHH